ncbi:hypothetical protein [Prescottella agglutinans]|uniref:hypothetical protein n=1 Tax=Prescottella agglutinans TaxID=1644129 RepID=UPI0013E3DDEC|nr:hypothetical protein [Prescottella agglutinans]
MVVVVVVAVVADEVVVVGVVGVAVLVLVLVLGCGDAVVVVVADVDVVVLVGAEVVVVGVVVVVVSDGAAARAFIESGLTGRLAPLTPPTLETADPQLTFHELAPCLVTEYPRQSDPSSPVYRFTVWISTLYVWPLPAALGVLSLQTSVETCCPTAILSAVGSTNQLLDVPLTMTWYLNAEFVCIQVKWHCLMSDSAQRHVVVAPVGLAIAGRTFGATVNPPLVAVLLVSCQAALVPLTWESPKTDSATALSASAGRMDFSVT